MTDVTPPAFQDPETGRWYYSHRSYLNSKQTKARAANKARNKERERFLRLGLDTNSIDRMLGEEQSAA